jgi:hypothetical protein
MRNSKEEMIENCAQEKRELVMNSKAQGTTSWLYRFSARKV